MLASYLFPARYYVVLSDVDNIIQGETIQFKAEVFNENGKLSSHSYTFIWSDNASHSATFEGRPPAYWNVTYDINTPPDVYNVSVKVERPFIFIKTTVGSASVAFNVMKYIHGDIILKQGNFTRSKYISNNMPVNHTIALNKSHLEFLNKTTNFKRIFWFVDCIYYGPQAGFEFDFNYTKIDSKHYVEALLVAANMPKEENLSISVTTVDSAHVPETGNQTNVTMPSVKQNVTSNNTTRTDIDEKLMNWLVSFNKTQSSNVSGSGGYCLNSSVIPEIPNYTYGFFKTNFTVKAPVIISPINGTNWLMDGEILNISVSCNGSSPFKFCVLLRPGLYNITGNETCHEETILRNCSFEIQHLFKRPSEYTLVVIISNEVSRVIKPIAVNIYKVKKHAQLSVIIVPVSFSLIATILIIFGVAYYVQSKHKYTIEVADFDFGNQVGNMEYKTFRERLRESISNSFLKSNDYEDDDSTWSESVPTSRKYGSMQ
ncbi:hypothetical protein RUM43_004532 [Polyplax serrata]|uniref:Uncharacterized protein n=1 Tax=Polyplax serrata TaxID=468196 RepID=A0AAN8XLL9_POLSC